MSWHERSEAEVELADGIVSIGRRLYARGLSPGSTGNVSVRLRDATWLATPTNSCLGELSADRLSLMGRHGEHLGGDPASKEAHLHAAVYAARPDAGAIVHLHSTAAVAVSCLVTAAGVSPLEPHTPYLTMRAGSVGSVPYRPPGSDDLAALVHAGALRHGALLLDNHGPLVWGRDLREASFTAEEFEEAARVQLALRGCGKRVLGPQELQELRTLFGTH